jgi:Trk K+ transport system NAD-binding subunit
LGQQCVIALQQFGVNVNAVEMAKPAAWEVQNLDLALTSLTIGDCRQAEVLEQAGVKECRAVLLVTSNERINIEAAFACRRLNPTIRLVVRSAKQNLNDLLGLHLRNFVAFEPTQLSASTFALTGLGEEILGFFNLDRQLVRAVCQKISPEHRWYHRQLHELNSRTNRVIGHRSKQSSSDRKPNLEPASAVFHTWEPDARLQVGDELIYVEIADVSALIPQQIQSQPSSSQKPWQLITPGLLWRKIEQCLWSGWQWISENQTRRVVGICGFIATTLSILSLALFATNYPDISLPDAFFVTAVLMLGGYGDLFPQIPFDIPIPWWLRLFALGLSLTGIALVGVLYGLLNERILSARFQFLSRRPPVPLKDHLVIIGLGRVGQKVAERLHELKQPIVGLSSSELDPEVLPQVPVIVGNVNLSINKANLSTAKGTIAVTDDEMVNLEISLMTHAINPGCKLVIRAFEQNFSDNLTQLLPYANVLCAHAISAEAFVAAAFGENILSLFRINQQNILVTEYTIEGGDTLNGRILAEVAYGYGVVPILHQEPQKQARFMPSDYLRLNVGDRLIVLASTDGLRRIEIGSTLPRSYQIRIEKVINQDAAFEGANAIARISGCSIVRARETMANLPIIFSIALYQHQAQQLLRELRKAQVSASIIASST